MSLKSSENTTQLFPPIFTTFVGVGFLCWAYTYQIETRLFPVIVGWMWIILSGLDIVASSGTKLGDAISGFFTGQIIDPKNKLHGDKFGRKSIVAITWVIAFIGGVYLLGFFLVIPIYIFLFVVLQGRNSIRVATISSVGTIIFIWLVFAVIFNYPIFKGILFEGF